MQKTNIAPCCKMFSIVTLGRFGGCFMGPGDTCSRWYSAFARPTRRFRILCEACFVWQSKRRPCPHLCRCWERVPAAGAGSIQAANAVAGRAAVLHGARDAAGFPGLPVVPAGTAAGRAGGQRPGLCVGPPAVGRRPPSLVTLPSYIDLAVHRALACYPTGCLDWRVGI